MANVMNALKDEITRLARKEVKVAITPLRKPTTAARKTLADLKRRVEALESELARLQRVGTTAATAPKQAATAKPQEAAAAAGPKARITAKTVKSLRKKLQLPVTQFAKLVGVTPKWVYMWELKSGPLQMRAATRESLLNVRGMSVREAAQRLAELTPNK